MNEIFHRTSIRKYQNKFVEDDKIEKMLQAAMAAECRLERRLQRIAQEMF